MPAAGPVGMEEEGWVGGWIAAWGGGRGRERSSWILASSSRSSLYPRCIYDEKGAVSQSVISPCADMSVLVTDLSAEMVRETSVRVEHRQVGTADLAHSQLLVSGSSRRLGQVLELFLWRSDQEYVGVSTAS